MRGVLAPVGPLGVLVMVLVGCGTSPSESALMMTCDTATAESLGVPTTDQRASFTTSGGRLRFAVMSLPAGTIFGDVNDTEVRLAAIDRPDVIRYRVTSSPRQPGVIDVAAGTYSVMNSSRGSIDVEACANVTLTEIDPSLRTPRSSPSTGSTSPAPTGDGTPGTSPSGQ